MSGIMTEKAFNPRSYKRSDLTIYEKQLQVAFLSIHAPTRGATKSHTMYPINAVTFNPRSYKRSDVSEAKTEKYLLLSIHAPTRGATLI